MGLISVTRYHDFSAGHRVVGHEGKCALLHGHNYRVHFTLAANALDSVGRVLDFGVIKSLLCEWLEHNWDHKFLAWEEDAIIKSVCTSLRQQYLFGSTSVIDEKAASDAITQSLVFVPFNPTAENMAKYLVDEIGPFLLCETPVRLVKVVIEETRKCSAAYESSGPIIRGSCE